MMVQHPSGDGPGGTRVLPRAVRVRDAAEAAHVLRVAAALGLWGRLPLVSPPGAALSLGPRLFLAQMRRAAALAPEAAGLLEPWPVLDCADAPGLALGALRAGVPVVILRPDCAGFGAVAAVAAEMGLSLRPDAPPCAGPFSASDAAAPARLAQWLGQGGPEAGKPGGGGDSARGLG